MGVFFGQDSPVLWLFSLFAGVARRLLIAATPWSRMKKEDKRVRQRGKAGVSSWSQVAWLTGEMILASASVIHVRTGRMAKAGRPLSAKDRKEFSHMVLEKIDAGREAASALALASLDPGFMRTEAAVLRATKAMIKPFHKRATANARRLKSK